jgi:hypothetical protein
MSDFYFKIGAVTGASIDDCHLLVYRSDRLEFLDDDTTEWRLLRRDALGLRELGRGDAVPRLWVSPTGRVHLVGRRDGVRGLHVGNPAGDAVQWTFLPAVTPPGVGHLSGVWGLDDDLVFVWGGGAFREVQRERPGYRAEVVSVPTIFTCDGSTWRPHEAPEVVYAVHGVPGAVLAAGAHGALACWTGSGWSAMRPPADVSFSFVHVVSAEEMYAATFAGRFFEGSQHGWRELPGVGAHVYGMAWWRGELLVTTQDAGILALEKGRFVPRRPGMARGPHVGRALLWIDGDTVAETEDLARARWIPADELRRALDAEPSPA